ncbi:hypothetical protein M9Y10_020057 [Tritrichomonas musculus]|uniref:aspartyl aminopeptidase n=1 Tax=Tritrichomonas musculus TaxID=1915356 RepID=A0ABR2HF40_9EUKA
MTYIKEFCSFIDQTPTPMHFCQKAREELVNKGFVELKETEVWDNIPNKFFVVRDERAIAAFNMHDNSKALIVATHNDSPCFRGKPNTYLQHCGLDQARIAPYGLGQWYTWFDRDLKIAGRILYKDGDSIKSKLFQSPEAVAIIPSLAIHLNRDLSTATNFNLEDDIMPVLSLAEGKSDSNQSPALLKAIASSAGIEVDNIVDFDVYFVDCQGPVILGTDQELLSSPRLDDQSCAITALRAFIDAPDPVEGSNIFLSFDAEEIGSRLRTGANSNFFTNILDALEVPQSFNSNSFIISADNCHANHPNYPSKNDRSHPIYLGDGVAYSWRANNSFATDTSSLNKLNKTIQDECLKILKPAVTRNDSPGGRTIGPILSTQLGIETVDLGIPVLGMHSIHETCAVKDIETLLKYFKDFYNHLSIKKD